MQLDKSLTTKAFAVIALAVFFYAAIGLVIGWSTLAAELRGFPWLLGLPLAALSLINYGLRFVRWELFLRFLGLRIPLKESLGLYFATYLMVITPGKIGEVFKASILRERYGFSLSRGLPAVLAERIYDLLAVLILAAIGLFYWPGSLLGMKAGLCTAALLPVSLLVFKYRPLRRALLSKLTNSSRLASYQVNLDVGTETLSQLITWRISLASLLLSVVAWFGECAGLWLVCRGLGSPIGLGEALFVYAAGTIVGSLSFLPGGIGGAEATLIWLLHKLALSTPAATTVALVVRLFTLWLAVLFGFLVFLAYRQNLLATTGREPDTSAR